MQPNGITVNLCDEEKDLSRQMMSYWTNFAKTGQVNRVGLRNLYSRYKFVKQKHPTICIQTWDTIPIWAICKCAEGQLIEESIETMHFSLGPF